MYIPNMDPSTGDQSLYRTNTTNIEVVLKKMSNGEKLTFMRFVFPRYVWSQIWHRYIAHVFFSLTLNLA